MKKTPIVGGIAGLVFGFAVGITAFGNPVTAIGIAMAFGCGIGGVLLAFATSQDPDRDP